MTENMSISFIDGDMEMDAVVGILEGLCVEIKSANFLKLLVSSIL